MGVGCPCPPVHNNIAAQRHLFSFKSTQGAKQRKCSSLALSRKNKQKKICILYHCLYRCTACFFPADEIILDRSFPRLLSMSNAYAIQPAKNKTYFCLSIIMPDISICVYVCPCLSPSIFCQTWSGCLICCRHATLKEALSVHPLVQTSIGPW